MSREPADPRIEPEDTTLEPERYELDAGPAYRFEVDRRDFVKLLGGGLVVCLSVRGALAQESGRGGRGGPALPRDVAAWLHVAEDGTVTVYTGKVEFGQDIRTSLTQAVADELKAKPGSIRLVMGDTDLVPFDQGTFGSRTTPAMAPQLRKMAAAAREALASMAAEQWKVERAAVVVADGAVTHPATKRSLGFGQLTRGRKLVRSVGDDLALTPAQRWTVAGRGLTKVNAREIVTGRHEYTSDMTRPGLLHGKVLRAPAFGAVLGSIDTTGAEAVKGAVVVRDGDFAGVAAASAREAERAVRALRAEWKTTPQPSGAELFAYLKKTPPEGREGGGGRGSGRHVVGSVEQALQTARHRLEQSYTVAYIAHVPLEPRAAVAEWSDGKLTVWTGTQRPFGVRGELAEAFRLTEDKVRVIVPDTGSGYGGKHSGEVAIEAARLAKAAGRPVKVVWTREEELTWAYFRPAGVIDVRSGASEDGTLVAWEFHNYNSGASAIRTSYEVPNQTIEFHPARSPLRQGSYRGLAATANHFAREVHMDELAGTLGMDPLELRRRNLKEPRLRAVLDAAADRFGWGRRAAEGRGHGISVGTEKGSYVGTCAEVAVDRGSGRVRVVRLVCAFECGAVVNPDHLRNQVEGSLLMGLGGALFEAVRFHQGRILNNSLAQYRVPRFSDTPQVEVVLLDRKDLPSAGAGETPIVGVAPAIAGAIFQASGVRLRSLPLAPEGLKAQA
jgi:isoquinoline 1-oxidoreductase